MDTLLEQSSYYLKDVNTNFKRFLYDRIKWKNRLIGIKGAMAEGTKFTG
jgi:hypothetical protein